MATKIVTKNSSTASAVPTASDLVQGELAVNVADKRLFTEDNAGAIVELGTNPSTIDINAGSIDGTAIGASSASTGAFTTLTATGAFTSLGIDDNATSTAITIDSSENVGIGTSSPAQLIHGKTASGNAYMRIERASLSTGQVGLQIGGGTSSVDWFTYMPSGSNDLAFFGNSAERMRIDASGNTLLQTGGAALQWQNGYQTITGDAASNDLTYRTYANHIWKTTTGASSTTDGTERMRIDSSGNVGIGNSAPLGKLTISNAAGTNAPSTVTAANTYLQLGSDDYGPSNNGKFMIGFGFTDATNTNSPAYIGYEEASTSGDTYGDLTFYTRSVTTDTAPTERMRIDSSGQVKVGTTGPTWDSTFRSFVTKGGFLASQSTSYNYLGGQAYYDGAFKRLNANAAELYEQSFGNHIFYNAISGAADSTITWNEQMRIDSSGNVGIGGNVLVGAGNGNEPVIQSTNSGRLPGSPGFTFRDNFDTGMYQPISTPNTVAFSTAATERMRIDSSGNLLVGTTSVISLGKQCIEFDGYSENGLILKTTNTSMGSAYLGFVNSSGAVIGSINQLSTSTVAYNTSSDQRLKENIADADDAGSKIDSIQVRKYDWKADGSHQDYGMIAQELQAVAPEAVSGDADSEEMMGVDYSKLVPMLIKEIQSLRNRVAQLEE